MEGRVVSADQIQIDQSELRMKPRASGCCRGPHHKPLRKGEEVANFSFFTTYSAAEAQVFGVKFIELYGTEINILDNPGLD